MSTQSLNELSRGRYYKEFEAKLKTVSDTYFYKKHFLLDCEQIDKAEARHTLLMYSFLDTKNCEIRNFIQDEIDGKEIKNTKIKAQNINSLINESSVTIIEHPMHWTEVAW